MSSAGVLAGRRLQQFRKAQHLNIRTLAKLAGVQPSSIGRLERSGTNARLSTLVALTAALDISLDDLLNECPHVWRTICQTCGEELVGILPPLPDYTGRIDPTDYTGRIDPTDYTGELYHCAQLPEHHERGPP